ncbi:MAG: tetratricopeptide repeat protein [Planctomycetes bacterium]|nr:tetratricopeptide repeat protein [Planctomycetota bacterium]
MSLPTSTTIPSAAASSGTPPSSRHRRLRWVSVQFHRFRQWFTHQPRVVRNGLVVVTALGLIASAVYTQIYLKRRATTQATVTAWKAYQEAAEKTDLDGMQAALNAVSAVTPGDPTPARYREMIDRGEADADNAELAVVLMTYHRSNERLPEAAREAEKVLVKYPKHWLARCFLAHHALQELHNPARAEQILNQLPDPEDPQAKVRLDGVLYALRLFDILGRDATQLRGVVLRKLVPLLKTPAAANASAAAKVQLVTCYLEPFADPSAISQLSGYWAAADKLTDDAATEAIATGDVGAMVRIAELGSPMRIALALLRDNDPERLPPDRFQTLLKALDDRTRRLWQAIREKEPQRPESYRGIARLALQDNKPVEAIQAILDGLAACGDQPEFLEQLVTLVARFGTEDSIQNLANRIWKSAEATKTDPVKWCLAAEAALVVNRPDKASLACRNALAVRPNDPWACATLARILVRNGKFIEAREALAPLGATTILLSPTLTRLHARILVGSGLWILHDDEYKKVTDAQAKLKVKSSIPSVAFLQGVLDASPDVERAAWVAARAELILAADPNASGAALARAEALHRLANLTVTAHPEDRSQPPVWNASRVTAALRAIGQLTLEQRAEPEWITTVAMLQLKGEGNAGAALRTITPLLARQATATPAQLEILGQVLSANNRPAEAVRLLEPAARVHRPSAGCLVALALAYHKNHQPIDAARTLKEAEDIPNRTDREQAELIAAKFMFLREKP